MEIKKYVLNEDKRIVDCVEVGDLLRVFDLNYKDYRLMEVIDIIQRKSYKEYALTSMYISYDVLVNDNIVKELYKKQPNGDFKKYEVKE